MHIFVRLLLVTLILSATVARAAESFFDIPPQPLSDALVKLSEQADTLIMAPQELVSGKKAPEVRGMMSVQEALDRLLEGSGLKAAEGEKGGITIREAAYSRSEAASIQMAQTESSANAGDSTDISEGPKLEEIVVTAQKRVERLQDVPVPVTALTAESLVLNNQVRLQDYFSQVPGLNLINGGRSGISSISIRGITTGGFGNTSAGILIDDVPFGSSLALGGGSLAPDFDPNDLARVEVLRGPQGTLYGATAMGGLVKYVTVAPSTEGVSGRLQGGMLGIQNGDGLGYTARGSLNVPLSDTVAVRVSGFSRKTPGYVDDPVQHIAGINKEDAEGGRAALLWRPSETFTLTLNGFLQTIDRDGSSKSDPTIGDLQQSDLPGSGIFHRRSGLFSAVAELDLGGAKLTSVTGYNFNKLTGGDEFFGFALLFDDNRTHRFTQEIRASLPLGSRVEWLVGAFYQDEGSSWRQSIAVPNGTPGENDVVFSVYQTPQYSEVAGFTDLTVHFTDQFDVQFGVRQSHERQSMVTTTTVPDTDPTTQPEIRSTANPFTYLLTPRYKFGEDLMVYARFASGYRPGGPNAVFTPGLPTSFRPDTTRNYELGAKGNLLGNTLSYDLSVYYIDWRNIQLSQSFENNFFTANAAGAHSKGVELSLAMHPIHGMTISAWGAYNDARLSQDFPATSTTFGSKDDKLPFSSRESGHAALEQHFRLGGAGLMASVGGGITYVGKRQGDFIAVLGPRQFLPAYTQVDLHAGIQHGAWSLDAFTTNITDKRGLLGGGVGTTNSDSFEFIQPRTMGLVFAWEF
jgi:outer membrane receptor protein involved in Fe transport